MTREGGPRAISLISVIAALAMAGLADRYEVQLAAASEGSAQHLIQRVIAQTTRAGVAVRAVRELRAGTRAGKHQGWMAVETIANPSSGFRWTVIDEGGSERTRNKVFRELLRNEAAAWRDGSRDAAALSPANYEFDPLPETQPHERQIRLKPRRSDANLVDGILTVSSDGFPLRLEGTLVRSPSFWVKSVTIVKHYGRFAGVALPTTIESLADVRMLGQSSLTMRFRYSEVNGRSIPETMSAAPSFNPSAEILALYAAHSRQN
jgi:hypothetical protein